MQNKITNCLFSIIVATTFTTTPAFAQSEGCPQGAVEFCYCIYEATLDDLMQMRGNNQATIEQRVSAAKKALKSCLNRGSDQAFDGVKKTN